ncbi:MAG: ribbon-helix-helix domain-containing protein [Gemmatimonadetes bacterium]|nr:ribbon-helix-helix domain-containing protein [Candidatus Palauibacter australiensis]
MRPISLKMPGHLAREVSEAARRRGVSRSALIREVLEAFLHREGSMPPVSALSRAAEFAGAFQGPEDLSANPDYMRGFGR